MATYACGPPPFRIRFMYGTLLGLGAADQPLKLRTPYSNREVNLVRDTISGASHIKRTGAYINLSRPTNRSVRIRIAPLGIERTLI